MYSAVAAVLALALAADPAPPQGQPHKVSVVDQTNGRGIPLVELRTIDNVRFVTSSQTPGMIIPDKIQKETIAIQTTIGQGKRLQHPNRSTTIG